MNKQEIQNKIDDLQKQIDEIKKQLNEADNARWRAEKGGYYYYICDSGSCIDDIIKAQEGNIVDNYRYKIGNYFKTFEEAKNCKDNLIIKQKLKDLVLKLNNGVEIDWKNDNQRKYYIFYSYPNHELSDSFASVYKSTSSIYCTDKNFLSIAIQEIGEEALIKLIKSGV